MNRSMKIILLLGILLLSTISVSQVAIADTHILPTIKDGATTPVNDGNITRAEYNNSALFNTTLFNQKTTVFVTSNSTHLFIGFNISTSTFLSVNDTIPTVSGYQLGYNNETHDWFAVVIDNNLDQAATANSVGTATSPDDVVVLDQYYSGGYDGYANGSNIFLSDANQTLTNGNTGNVTKLIGNDGQNNVITSRIANSDQVSYEITKPLTNVDKNGYDFVLSQLGILSFSIYQFSDSQANDTLQTGIVDNTPWFSLRVNDTGTAQSIIDPATSNVNVIYNDVGQDQFSAFSTLAELYNFNVSYTPTVTVASLNPNALNIVVFGKDSGITQNDTIKLTQFVRDGGNLMLMVAPGAKSTVSTLVSKFGMTYLSHQTLSGGTGSNTTMINVDSFNSDLPLQSAAGIFTNRTFDNVTLYGGALNTTSLYNKTNEFVLGQEYMPYDLFTTPSGVAYDANNNGTIDGKDNFNHASLGVAIDLLKGGRLTVIPSLSLIEDGNATLANNQLYLLGLLAWNSQFTNTLKVNSVSVNTHKLAEYDSVNIVVNMTTGLNQSVVDGVLMVEVMQAGEAKETYNLTQNGDIWTGSIPMNYDGFLTLAVTGHSKGNGFAEGESVAMQVQIAYPRFNNLSKLSPIVIGVFIVSIALYALTVFRVKDYK